MADKDTGLCGEPDGVADIQAQEHRSPEAVETTFVWGLCVFLERLIPVLHAFVKAPTG